MVIHIVTDALPPTKGGLEIWTDEFADYLVDIGHNVIAYRCGDVPNSEFEISTKYEICNLATLRAEWDRPLLQSNRSTERKNFEIWRLNFLILRGEMRKRLVEYPNVPHLIFSNFAVTVGYLASLVSQDLSLPHLAMFVGTDFSRGFRNSYERGLIREVCLNAYQVVCKSEEQGQALKVTFAPKKLTVIPTSVDLLDFEHENKSNKSIIRLFSDCGLNYHKGTQVLIQSVLSLISEGLPIHLTICGAEGVSETEYWDDYVNKVKIESAGSIEFLGYITRNEIKKLLLDSSIYCSATLGEGSSAARIRAICCGIPVVTTRCGEFVNEIENDVSHVFLSDPADSEAFKQCIREAIMKIINGKLNIDWNSVRNWQNKFSRSNELLAWSALLNELNII